MKNPDQQIVEYLIINIEHHMPANQSEGDSNSTESFIKEAFRSIQHQLYQASITTQEYLIPVIPELVAIITS